ncbi:MAG: hypothetical protein ACXWQO_10895 [Bdellovibrionota bacterium]
MKRNRIVVLAAIFMALCQAQVAQAYENHWYSYLIGYSAPIPAGFAPYLSLGGEILYGNTASVDSTTTKSRTLFVYGAETVLGARWRYFVFGVGAEAALWKQRTDPATIDNSNTQGKMIDFGPTIGLAMGSVNLLGTYNLYSHYKPDNATLFGKKVVYSSPTSYAFELQTRGSRWTYWGVKYTHTRYKKSSAGTAEATDFTSGDQLNFNAYGLVFGMEY